MKKTIPLLAILMAELCLATPLAAATARTATENFVTNKIAAAISQIPPPDYSTNNVALVETIEAKAPTPGNYASVSNRAMNAVQLDVKINDKSLNRSINLHGTDISVSNLMGSPTVAAALYNKADKTDVNYTTSNATLVATIKATAPTPGDYAAVSNAAMNALSRNGGTVTLSNGFFAVGYDDYGRVAGFVPCIAVDTTGVDPIITIGDDYAGHGGAGETYFRNPVRFKDYASVDFEHGFTTIGDRGQHEVYVNGWPRYIDYALVTDITPAVSNAVPAWALAAQKPTYTASEVGATSPTAVSNIVTAAYVRERLGVYLYVGEDGGIYVHTNED